MNLHGTSDLLELIEAYESTSRPVIAYNVRDCLMSFGISGNAMYYWLADLLGTTRNTTYSWFAPNRDAKFPLKALLKVSLALEIPVQSLLESDKQAVSYDLRQKKERPSYEREIKAYLHDHPGAGAKEISNVLNIAYETARRHLSHIKDEKGR